MNENLGREQSMLLSVSTHWLFIKSVMISVAETTWELFFINPAQRTQWTTLQSIGCFQTCCEYQLCHSPTQKSVHGAVCTTQFSCYNARLWTVSPQLWPQRWTQLITSQGYTESYTNENTSCKSATLKKSGSDWFGIPVIQYWSEKMQFSCSHVLSGSAKSYRPITYSLSNMSAKNYQNQLMHIEAIACHIRVVLRHSIHVCIFWSRWHHKGGEMWERSFTLLSDRNSKTENVACT